MSIYKILITDDLIANTIDGTCMLFINLELQLLIGINRLTPTSDQNFSLQYQYNMKKIDENKIYIMGILSWSNIKFFTPTSWELYGR